MTHCGFNVQWLYTAQAAARGPDERVLDAMAAWGVDLLRLPTDYRLWSVGGDPYRVDESVLGLVDEVVRACRDRSIHLSLNLHRAPGYIITGWESEPYNLWADPEAQAAFVATWARFAQRYAGVPTEALSFDLVNEPPAVGQRGFTRAAHEAVIREAAAAIRSVSPHRPLVADGLNGGNLALPELADLGATHSVRGYQPMCVSHHGAPWWSGGAEMPTRPAYPVQYDGRWWDPDGLRDFYEPWRQVEDKGVPVHVGEFGWGYALWEFEGPFGIVGHARPGAVFENLDGFRVDRRLLDLMQANRGVS